MSARDYYIDFDTKATPGKIIATRVTLDRVVLEGDSKKMRVDLVADPLYPNLLRYVVANRTKIT